MGAMRVVAALLLALSWAGSGVWAQPPASGDDDRKSRQITGVVKEIFRDQMKIKMKTDLNKVLVVEVPRSDLLKGLTAEDRIIVELNDRGEASKVTKVAPPELPGPPGGNTAPAQEP